MKKLALIFISFFTVAFACCDNSDDTSVIEQPKLTSSEIAEQNILRSMEIVDNAVESYFKGDNMVMSRYYNPYTQSASSELASVWMYTSSIEAVNSIMEALETQKSNGNAKLYNDNFDRYKQLLAKLYDNIDYYLGTYSLTSFTQTKEWSVYAVNRSSEKGKASVSGIDNVYDDQEWLIRELINSYNLTKEKTYLDKAEYLASYVLDGWDCIINENGEESGGIPWGPGYVTKHSCSNGPFISPLVWLYELYRGKSDEVTYGVVDINGNRKSVTEKKSKYYLSFAKKIYDWQKKTLMNESKGVYYDMLGGCTECSPSSEIVDGVKYRKHENLTDPTGDEISYNSGTMLSGGSDLYRVTLIPTYLNDIKSLSDASFGYFAKLNASKEGYYSYSISGFNNWFNNVLMRGFVDVYPRYNGVSTAIESFQKNLDYAYDKYLYKKMLPTNLLVGWSLTKANNNVEGMFTFAFAAEYAALAKYELQKGDDL